IRADPIAFRVGHRCGSQRGKREEKAFLEPRRAAIHRHLATTGLGNHAERPSIPRKRQEKRGDTVANPRRERSASEQIAGMFEANVQDDSERHQLMQWLEQMRNIPASASYHWRPVLLVALGL